jgi:hypothetical protein
MRIMLAAVALGLMMAAAHAKLPAAPAPSEAEKAAKAAKAEKDAGDKAKEAAELGKAQDKAVANYKKNKSVPMDAKK